MSTVGEGFGAFNRNKRRMFRAPVNPLDKATIVSSYPRQIDEIKHTLFPGRFTIPAAEKGDFNVLVLGPSSWWKEMEESQPDLEITTSSVEVAKSVVMDYCASMFLANGGDKMPAVFYVPGAFTKLSIKSYKDEAGKTFDMLLNEAREKQLNWYSSLIAETDMLWSKSSGNPYVVSDEARVAAKFLSLNKSWLENFQNVEMQNCVACGHLINPIYPVCPNCKNVINQKKAAELGLKFAV